MFENDNIKKLSPYKTSSHSAWESDNATILKLDWNESTIPPSPNVMDYVQEKLKNNNINWYPDTDNTALRAKIADYCKVAPENVEYFASSDSLHEYIFQCYVKSDTSLLRLTPTYDNFRAVADSYGVNIIDIDINNIESDASILTKEIQRISPSIIYLCNPNNPTGHLFDKDSLVALFKKFSDILFIIDEAYYEFNGVTVANEINKFSNVIICRTFSKAFGIASFRIGYAISSSYNIETLKKVRNAKNITMLSQHAAMACLEDVVYMKDYVSDVIKAKDKFYEFLEEIDYVKKYYTGAGNYVLFQLDNNIQEIFIEYLKKNGVYIRSFKHIPGHARITIGTTEQMEQVKELFIRFKS